MGVEVRVIRCPHNALKRKSSPKGYHKHHSSRRSYALSETVIWQPQQTYRRDSDTHYRLLLTVITGGASGTGFPFPFPFPWGWGAFVGAFLAGLGLVPPAEAGG